MTVALGISTVIKLAEHVTMRVGLSTVFSKIPGRCIMTLETTTPTIEKHLAVMLGGAFAIPCHLVRN